MYSSRSGISVCLSCPEGCFELRGEWLDKIIVEASQRWINCNASFPYFDGAHSPTYNRHFYGFLSVCLLEVLSSKF